MQSIVASLLAEMEHEAKTTRKFLNELPIDQMSYKPHEKSMSTGQLAMHIASLPGLMAEWAAHDVFEMAGGPPSHKEPTRDEVLSAFEESLEKAKGILIGMDNDRMMGTWTFKVNGQIVMEMPRVAMIRSFMMNHLYHHRGQLGVYLRMLGAKVPSSYGPSGDENPLAELLATTRKG